MNVMYDVKRNGQSSNDRTVENVRFKQMLGLLQLSPQFQTFVQVTVSYRQDRTSVENRSVTVNGIISDEYEVPISIYDARNAGSNDGVLETLNL